MSTELERAQDELARLRAGRPAPLVAGSPEHDQARHNERVAEALRERQLELEARDRTAAMWAGHQRYLDGITAGPR